MNKTNEEEKKQIVNGLIALGGTPGEKTAHERKFLESYADSKFQVGSQVE